MSELYYNGRIITMEESDEEKARENAPEAVFVRCGRIVGVGKLSDLEKVAGKKAKRIDLQGRCLMPAFIDPHGHIVMNGQMSLCAFLGKCESFEDIIDTLKRYIREKNIKSGEAVIGYGYDHNFLAEQKHPDKEILDQVSVECPVFIMHVSAHMGCANSRALHLAGITEETPDPEGGIIGRMHDGREPSGYLEEGGLRAVQSAVGKMMKLNPMAMIGGMQEKYIQHGITTVQDGATTSADWKILRGMAFAGRLKVDVVAYPLMPDGGIEILHRNAKRVGAYQKHLKLGGYKLVLDGSPQGRSAWMTEPYLGGEPDYCGYPWMKDEEVEKYVRIALDENRQLLAHCNGDAASEQFLDAYEKALKETGSSADLRPVMIHCQTVRKDQLDRMSRLHMIASIFVGHVFYWGDIHKKNFGEKRGNNISPVRDALDRKIVVNFHQDTPVTEPDMLHSIWVAVNRISRKGDVIGSNQRISVYEALQAATIGGAYQYFEEDSKGTICEGKRADFVILDKSPLEVDKMEIKDILVLETIKDGKQIFALNQ